MNVTVDERDVVVAPVREDDLPLEVVPDWDAQVERASRACVLIDRHLDHEARGRGLRSVRSFGPQHMCPEQRVQMMADVFAIIR